MPCDLQLSVVGTCSLFSALFFRGKKPVKRLLLISVGFDQTLNELLNDFNGAKTSHILLYPVQ